jgi:F0F1-type ATP synthase assembly protein I
MGKNPPESASKKRAPENQWLELLNLGWIFAASMGLTVFGGLWLDKRYGTAPLFILIGVLLGFAITGVAFWQSIRKFTGVNSGKSQE